MTTIRDGWETYKGVLPADAGPEQRTETRRAFYAGAGHVLSLLFAIGEDDAIDEDIGSEMLDAYRGELEAFLRELRKGRA
jgi:hypothetical protein